jgi:DNA-binding NarL/FixJ family response regulator
VSAYALGEESLALCRAINHRGCLARTLDLLGRCALQQGHASRAQPLFEESLALFRVIGERRNAAWALSRLARVATVQGDNGVAQTLYEESWAIFKESGDTRGQASCLQGLAGVAARQGEVVRAARLWGAAQSLHETSSPHDPFILPDERTDDEQSVAAARAQLGEQTFAAAWAEGRTMTPEQAIAAQGQPLVSNQPPAKPRTNAQKRLSPTFPNGLTEREVEVLRLLARGLTDAQIAEALVISPRTVNAHLRSIYTKLNVTSRNAAAHYALKQKLV